MARMALGSAGRLGEDAPERDGEAEPRDGDERHGLAEADAVEEHRQHHDCQAGRAFFFPISRSMPTANAESRRRSKGT